jgi:hypothetical protein
VAVNIARENHVQAGGAFGGDYWGVQQGSLLCSDFQSVVTSTHQGTYCRGARNGYQLRRGRAVAAATAFAMDSPGGQAPRCREDECQLRSGTRNLRLTT